MMDGKTFDELFDELIGFIHWLANDRQSDQTVIMSKDDLVGELMVEFTIGIQRYGGKPKKELKALLATMFDNRIRELFKLHHYTFRASYLDKNVVSVESDLDDDDDSESYKSSVQVYCQETIDDVIDYNITVQSIRNRLSPNAVKVFDIFVDGANQRVLDQLVLSSIRSSHVFANGGTIKLHPWQISEALLMDVGVVNTCLDEIKRVYSEVVSWN